MKTCPLCEKTFPSHHTNCEADGALLIDSRELEPGTVIRGKYRIVRQLGRGGMGTVYLAEHILLNRQRALKFISSDLSQDVAFLRRFRREAQAAIELQHPNVAQVVDLDQAEDGSPYIAMEYVDGPDLRHALDAGPFAVERALAIARGIAQGLGSAHAKGITHRDVKPENILLAGGNGAPETPKLLDFGIAAMKETATAVSRTHGLMLTPPYAAPEQWKGTAAEELDGRTDFYALGGVLYEMLTCQTPFHAHNTEGWMYKHLHEQPQPPSQLRPELANWSGLDALVLRLLAKDREDRPRDADDLLRLFDTLGQVVHAPSPRPTRQATVVEPPATPPPPSPEPRPSTTLQLPLHSPIPSPQFTPQPVPIKPRFAIWKWALNAVKWGLAAVLVVGLGFQALLWFRNSAPAPVHETQAGSLPATTSTANRPSAPTPASAVAAPAATGGTHPEAQQGTKPDYVSIARQANDLFNQKHYAEAASLYEQACDGGISDDCHVLGNMYYYGQGVAKDGFRAAAFHTKGCNGKIFESCNFLGSMYQRGQGVAKDESRAAVFYSKACDGGYSLGCLNLGGMYENGQGVAKDSEMAKQLFSKSCSLGDQWACNHLKQMPASSDQAARDQAARDQASREEAANTWPDPATRLVWAKKDNGGDVGWQPAKDYCRNLRLAGHSDWRLATIDELQGIYDPSVNLPGQCCGGTTVTWHVKDKLQLSGWHWSSQQGNASGEAWSFGFYDGKRNAYHLDDSYGGRALCVRRSGQ